MENYDILKYLIMPLVIVALHWQLYSIKRERLVDDDDGTWDFLLMVLWVMATFIGNFRFFFGG